MAPKGWWFLVQTQTRSFPLQYKPVCHKHSPFLSGSGSELTARSSLLLCAGAASRSDDDDATPSTRSEKRFSLFSASRAAISMTTDTTQGVCAVRALNELRGEEEKGEMTCGIVRGNKGL